ncbi:MAG: imidazole glycerol phosphate synthase cyclase subunit [Gemmatimonadota bacterium]
MKKRRIIPVLLLRNGSLVQSRGFSRYQNLGNPVAAVKRLSEWGSDELIYLDISRERQFDAQRTDLAHAPRQTFLEIIGEVASVTFMPMTVGGRIRNLSDMADRLALGADKLCINTAAASTPELITQAGREFGSQCVVVSIDAKVVESGYEVMIDGGRVPTGRDPIAWATEAQERGAGEILINSIDRDGAKTGYDLSLVSAVADAVHIPVIACGGVGEWQHFADALSETNVDAVAAANIFHYSDQSVHLARAFLHARKFEVRPPRLLSLA